MSLHRVARHAGWLAERYLAPADRVAASRLAIEKRRVDFIGGRVAAARAARALGLVDVRVAVEEGERAGAPMWIDAGGERLAAGLSISHGAGWAVAAGSRQGAVGVDVERIEPRHPAFCEEAFAAGELEAFARLLGEDPGAPVVVTLAWCAKEACLKRRGSGLREALHDLVLQPRGWLGAPGLSRHQLCWVALSDETKLGLWTGGAQVALALVMAR